MDADDRDRGESSSALPSPTDTRAPTRFTSLAGGREGDTNNSNNLSESFQSTDTVRRRPETYGTITSQGSSQYFDNSPTPTQDRPPQRLGNTPILAAARSPLLGPDRGRSRPRKPALSRRASSNVQAPHRGSVFSVDDAPSEVQADVAERQNTYAQPTTLRRRGVVGTGAPLSRIHSNSDNIDQEGEAAVGPTSTTSRSVTTPYSNANPSEPGFFDSTGIDADGNGNEEDDETIDRSFVIDRSNAGDDLDGEDRDGNHHGGDDDDDHDDDNDDDLSDAESFTLKDRQQAINETHPFGIRLWKPALYKKDRSVQKTAEGDIHSSPGGHVHNWLLFFNIMWTLCFGMWLALLAFLGAAVCLIFAGLPSGREYGRVLWGLSGYLFYPFGKFIRLEQQEAYLDEDLGEGRSISEYEQWQNGDLEYGRLFFGPERNRSIVGRSRRSFDSAPNETDSLIQHRTSATRHHGRYDGHAHAHADNRGHGADDEYDSDDEDASRDSDAELPRLKRRLFGRGQWNIGRVIFFLFFYILITPALFIVSGICWFLVFSIPMGRVTILLFDHLRRHPLALTFESDIATARAPTAPQSSIIVCTYRAVGAKYWKYTVDGTNIFLINLMAVVMFVIFDWLVLDGILHLESFITSSAFLFVAALLSIIPLAYFIGQAVASISAQSSMGVGAAINAFFSTIVEVFLYCVALNQGKSQLVEGSIVGSIFAGVLFLPGLSMCFGAIKRKTQRFNARSAGVTSTMLLFAVIGAFSPTLFYQIYGTHELNCLDCINNGDGVGVGGGDSSDCRRCFFSQTPSIDDRFYLEAVRPYCYVAASLLFLSYVIGLWFTLRTHAAVIWNTEIEEKRQEELAGTAPRHNVTSTAVATGTSGDATGVDIRDSHLYRRILGQSLKQVGLQPRQDGRASRDASVSGPSGSSTGNCDAGAAATSGGKSSSTTAKSSGAAGTTADDGRSSVRIAGFTEAESDNLVHQVAEMAATAATIAARDARLPRRASARGAFPTTGTIGGGSTAGGNTIRTNTVRTAPFHDPYEGGASLGVVAGAAGEEPVAPGGGEAGHGGHDAPNWSRRKSAVILMCATALYAVIAEILVDSVDFVLDGFSIDQKFLGITLFALVPNTTEFLNAISFAMNGNIALSMEIGSAYALQVCLLQIPALVLFSASFPPAANLGDDLSRFTFFLLFPQWDMVTVILCVFLLSYMYGEGKSNYFKGSILLLSYLVVIVGYYFSGYTNLNMDVSTSGLRRFDTMGLDGQYMPYSKSFKTVGRSRMGEAF
ncbi:Ca2+:H+ antiporter [Sporothrix schenckii 1099-18]|uniref:Ca2+:H+ antiporter n=1 Tax=Sporothrix schenckii 1099-18 TaxID=1397361 RepID=A0A0F2M0A9_SPOSC|nr:Ca2+:H+ antiporter [Sporothrix schenckii 1099-18]KJR82200.1 Ca2+:H+ antiporter [Sporothrix schenckii 1099-18]